MKPYLDARTGAWTLIASGVIQLAVLVWVLL